MKKYSAKVIETATVIKLYVVEAEDQDEALEKLEAGDTEEEVYLKDGEVINRVVKTNTIEEHSLTFSAELPLMAATRRIARTIITASACAGAATPSKTPNWIRSKGSTARRRC